MALGAGRWGSRQLHSASERSLWYAFLMLGILPSEPLRTPFQTVSVRSSRKFAQPRSNTYRGPAVGSGQRGFSANVVNFAYVAFGSVGAQGGAGFRPVRVYR